MTPERWQHVTRIHEAALEREPDARGRFLEEACAGDTELRREVESLLAHENVPVLIDSPVWDLAAEVLDPEPTLAPGTRVGPYRIEGVLGAGGMGQVYRAHDTQLQRDVALKTLPGLFTHDPERLARFRREAHVLASLNHPGIAAIYGFEESGGVHALVLELVEGPTLAQRLTRGAIPWEEALPIAHQIAQALAAAHERGILHRDLKPANIKVRDDGTMKILDLGLAKPLELASGAVEGEHEAASDAGVRETRPDVVASPLAKSADISGTGAIVGTAAYMSPEQAKGRILDRRSDVWALGCVLYEMLTGTRAFGGENVAATLAAVLKQEPDWHALPPDLPEAVRTLLTGCVTKDRKRRISDVSIVSYVLAEPPAQLTARGPARRPGLRRPGLAAAVVGMAVGALVTAVVGSTVLRLHTTEPPRVTRLALVTSAVQPLSFRGINRDIDISPDGTEVVYRAGNATQWQLLVRTLDQLEARPLPNTTFGNAPFFSPDGRWIGFSGGARLKKTPAAGGPAIVLCPIAGAPFRGASWAPSGTIVFADSDPATGLLSVPASGGNPAVLTRPDAARHERDHWFPSMLPDGQRVLFTVATDRPDVSQVAVLDLETGQRKTLIQGGSDARYVGSGHLVYVAGGTLRAVRLDPVTLEVLGDPVPVVDQVMTPPGGPGNFAVSKSGTLIHVLGGAEAQIWPSRSLVWVDRQGREEPIPAPPRAYASPRLSPDGTRIAVEVRAGEPAIWIWDLRRKTFQRLNADAFAEQNPVWTPDGRLVFASNRGGVPNVYRQASDGSAPAQALTSSTWGQYPFAVSRDASRVFLTQLSPLADIAVLVDGERRTELLIKRGNSPDISPSGQWLAYQSPFSVSSTEPGQSEIFVRPFPSVDRERVRVSPDGGSRPAWAPSGREMFYLDRRNRLTAVTVQTTGSTFTAGTPRTVLESEYFPDAGPAPGRPYDVSTNGRFLMIKENPMNDVRTPAASIIVVQNWFEELKRLVRGGIAPGRTR